jgi:hypothetical protein
MVESFSGHPRITIPPSTLNSRTSSLAAGDHKTHSASNAAPIHADAPAVFFIQLLPFETPRTALSIPEK